MIYISSSGELIWRTKDNLDIPVKQMSDLHLGRTIRLLKDRRDSAAYVIHMIEKSEYDIGELNLILRELKNEQKRRIEEIIVMV